MTFINDHLYSSQTHLKNKKINVSRALSISIYMHTNTQIIFKQIMFFKLKNLESYIKYACINMNIKKNQIQKNDNSIFVVFLRRIQMIINECQRMLMIINERK